MSFQYPIAFLLLPLFSFLLWLKSGKKESVGFPNLTTLQERIPQASWYKRHLVPLLGVITISIFVVALVNPNYSIEKVREVKETRLMIKVQDLSGSMEPYRSPGPDRKIICKADVALEGAKRFIDLRPHDYIALIAFASYAKLVTPGFITDHKLIQKKLNDIRPGTECNKHMYLGDSTDAAEAFWLSLSLFLNSLPSNERPSLGEIMDMRVSLMSSEEGGDFYIPPSLRGKDFGKGRIVIFYTDGQFDYYSYAYTERLNVLKLIRLMRHFGIKIYLLLADTKLKDVDHRLINTITLARDKEELKTAGKVFTLQGDDLSSVNTVYDQINELEKTKLVVENYNEIRGTMQILTLIGIVFLLGYIFLKYHNRFRRPEL